MIRLSHLRRLSRAGFPARPLRLQFTPSHFFSSEPPHNQKNEQDPQEKEKNEKNTQESENTEQPQENLNFFQRWIKDYQNKLTQIKQKRDDPKTKIFDDKDEEKESLLDKLFSRVTRHLNYEQIQEDFAHSQYKYLYLTILLCLLGYTVKDQIDLNSGFISYQQFFYAYLNHNLVNDILLYSQSKSTIAYVDIQGEGEKKLVLRNADQFLEQLEKVQNESGRSKDNFIPVRYKYATDTTALFETCIKGSGKGKDIMSMGKSKMQIFDQGNIHVKFKDVAGLDEAKQEIYEFVDFLKHPQKYKDIGARIPTGALLTGPPGTGKTMLAKACAGEAGVPFIYVSGSEFTEMYVGVGASRVRDLFTKAKTLAPAIIFIDEVDAIGKKRDSTQNSNDEKDSTLNQILVEMDGFGTDRQIIVLGATNRKEMLDPALTRPGRFDRSIDITLPDLEGRKQIFLVHLAPITLNPILTPLEYAKRLACLTPGFSGADIANLCNEAAIQAARHKFDSVSQRDFELASERVLAGVEKKRLPNREERKLVAVHESGHAVVSWFLKGCMPLVKVTIIPRSKGSLGFAQYLPKETNMQSNEELLDSVCFILGGRAAEQVFFGQISTGAYDDLKKAYQIAHNYVTQFGMSDKVGNVGFDGDQYFKQHSEATQRIIDQEVRKIIGKPIILDDCYEKALQQVEKYKQQIEDLSETLLEKETLDLHSIIKVLGERPFETNANFKDYQQTKDQIKKEIEINV